MTMLQSLRRRILTPDVKQTRMDVRGFHVKSPEARDRLEAVGRYFLTGYAIAAEAVHPADADERLDGVPHAYRGFAYEGASMAFAVRDGLPVGGSRHVEDFLAGPADAHPYMAYVGVGWAMARIPRFRWPKLHAPDPLLRWLVLDGYGFHQAYFKTRQYVEQRYQAETFPWPVDGPAWYTNRVIDQGVGRATWFVCGTDPRRVVATFERFDERRRGDLYAGAGLAATYAGGSDEAELAWFKEAAGAYAGDVAQGSAFAAAARVRAGLVVAHNEIATGVLCGQTPDAAAKVTDEALVGLPFDDELPAYEIWRLRIKAALTAGLER
ncbi:MULTISPECIES: DUF1702 family protein [unclassified Micromonospora]|uniref:DUF1702 family protein n=1 Tax=unclassified Micromonospora TaxID=2617518 RepID=UPI00362A5EAB